MTHDIDERLRNLEVVLGGDMMTNKKGMVQIVQDIATDMYDNSKGLSGRVTKLELSERDKESQKKGAILVGKLLWALIGAAAATLAFVWTHWPKLKP